MTTYVYETIPLKKNEKPRYFEIKQSNERQDVDQPSRNG